MLLKIVIDIFGIGIDTCEISVLSTASNWPTHYAIFCLHTNNKLEYVRSRIAANRCEAVITRCRARREHEIEQAMQEGIQKTNKMIGLGLDPSKSKDYDKFLEMQSIQQKYGNMIDDNLLKQIMVDDNPQRKAEVLATIDEAMKMQEKGMSPQEIIDIIKNTTRTKQAKGGSAGLDYLMGL